RRRHRRPRLRPHLSRAPAERGPLARDRAAQGRSGGRRGRVRDLARAPDGRRRAGHRRPAGRQGHPRAHGGGTMSGSLISGMTGFGRADGGLDGWTWTVEARSVNGRTLETRFRGPGGFDNLERLAKAAAQARLNRGQVTLGLQAKRAEGFEPAPRVNEAVLATYLRLANQLAQEGATAPSADGLLALRGVIEVAEEDEDAE